MVETCIAVVSACLPTLRPLLGKYAGLSSSKGKSDPSYAMARTQNSNSGTGGPSRRRENVEQGAVETDEETLIGGKGNLGGGKVLCA